MTYKETFFRLLGNGSGSAETAGWTENKSNQVKSPEKERRERETSLQNWKTCNTLTW